MMHVPETAAYFDDLPVPGKDNIRCPGQRFDMEAESVAESMDDPPNDQFRRRVLRADGAHDGRAFIGTEPVGHGVYRRATI